MKDKKQLVPSGEKLQKKVTEKPIENAPTIPNITLDNNDLSEINTEGGAFQFGVFNQPSPNKIALLIKASKALAEGSIEYQELIEELENYQKPREGREIIGLENKLKNAEMDLIIDEAKYLKSRAISKIAKYQFQSHKAAVHNYIYGKINEVFNAEILPLIQKGLAPAEINKVISNMIVQPVADEVCSADPTINSDTIRGMLYILTGNCHLTWK